MSLAGVCLHAVIHCSMLVLVVVGKLLVDALEMAASPMQILALIRSSSSCSSCVVVVFALFEEVVLTLTSSLNIVGARKVEVVGFRLLSESVLLVLSSSRKAKTCHHDG